MLKDNRRRMPAASFKTVNPMPLIKEGFHPKWEQPIWERQESQGDWALCV